MTKQHRALRGKFLPALIAALLLLLCDFLSAQVRPYLEDVQNRKPARIYAPYGLHVPKGRTPALNNSLDQPGALFFVDSTNLDADSIGLWAYMGGGTWEKTGADVGAENATIAVEAVSLLRGVDPSVSTTGLAKTSSNRYIISTIGYYSPNDNGGATYVWDPSSTDAEDGVKTFTPTFHVGAGRWELVFDGVLKASQAGVRYNGSDQTNNIIAALALSEVKILVFDNAISTSVTISDTVTVPAGKILRFQNDNKIIGTGAIIGGIIEANPQKQIFGTSVIVRNLENTEVWFPWGGAVPDNTIDCSPIMNQMKLWQKTYAVIRVPQPLTVSNTYRFLSTLNFNDRDIKIIAEGADNTPHTKFTWPGNTLCINAVAPYTIRIENLYISQDDPVGWPAFSSYNASAHGIYSNTFLNLKNLRVQNISGDGLHIEAGCGFGGNADRSTIIDCYFLYCMNGVFLSGCDANIISFDNLNVVGNRHWGVYDDGFLGNRYDQPHASANGRDSSVVVSYGGTWWAARQGTISNINIIPSSNTNYWTAVGGSGAPAWSNTTDYRAGGTTVTYSGAQYTSVEIRNINKEPVPYDSNNPWWFETVQLGYPLPWDSTREYWSGGTYAITNPNYRGTFIGPYSEGYQPPAMFNARTLKINGDDGAGTDGGVNLLVLEAHLEIAATNGIQVGPGPVANITTTGSLIVGNYATLASEPSDADSSDRVVNSRWAKRNIAAVGANNTGAQYQIGHYATTGKIISGNSEIVTDAYGNLRVSDTIRTGSVTDNLSLYFNPGAVAYIPSYSNSGGTGDRRASITVTTTLSTSGSISNLVDGSTTGDGFGFNANAVYGLYLRFDFGVGADKIITEIRFYQNAGGYTHGVWQGQGSDNGIDWTNIGATFTLGPIPQTITELSGNGSGYRYYQILGVSGNTNINPWVFEFEFKIDDYIVPAIYGSLQAWQVDGITPANTILQMNGGDVGIGIVPTAKLHVNGTAIISGAVTNANIAGTGNRLMQLDANGLHGRSTLDPANILTTTNGWSLSGNSSTVPGTNFIGTTDAQDLVFKVGSVERMRIQESNGWTRMYSAGTPREALDIGTGLMVGGTYSATRLNKVDLSASNVKSTIRYTMSDSSYVDYFSDVAEVGWDFVGAGTKSIVFRGNFIYSPTGGQPPIIFQQGGALGEKMRIDKFGNVIIGFPGAEDTSFYTLDVRGTAKIKNTLTFNGQATDIGTVAGSVYYNTTSNKFRVRDNVGWTDLATGTGVTNLSFSRNSTTVTVLSDNGTDAVLPLAVPGGDAGVMSGADKARIDSNNYMKNTGPYDSLMWSVNDSTIGFKTISVLPGINTTITKVITDSTATWQVNAEEKYTSTTQTGSTYTVADGIRTVFINYTGGTHTVTLPSAASWTDRRITIKNLHGSNNVSVSGVSASDGNTLLTRQSMEVQSDGTTWHIVGSHLM